MTRILADWDEGKLSSSAILIFKIRAIRVIRG